MTLRDRIRRWWAPAKWRDEHPEVSDGEDFFDDEQRFAARVEAEAKQFGVKRDGSTPNRKGHF